MAKILRWGILGTGNIARQFAAGVATSMRGRVVAVASRTSESATEFAREFHLASSYASYEAILKDPEIDAIYISTPNTLHHEWTLKAMRAGRHVLCEKPISVTAAQAEEMFDTARMAGRVLIEAFMYRAHPQTHRAMELVQSGAIGRVNLIRTSFCFRIRKPEGNIRFKPDLAGGAIMDVGCYCLGFSRLVAQQEPETINAVARLHESGVDELTSVIMKFPDGINAEFAAGMMTQADNTAYISGDEGYLKIPVPWKPLPGKGEVIVAHSIPMKQESSSSAPVAPPEQSFPINDARDVYAVEADAFAATVFESAPPFVSADDSIGNMRCIERIRGRIGLGSCMGLQ
jgi:D-xylose 1-dehydrogenase (NADP+, D-xylono-1,5-lactone-forming)